MSEEEIDKKIQDLIDKSERMMSTSTEFIGTNIKVSMYEDDKKVLLDLITLCIDLNRNYKKEKEKNKELEEKCKEVVCVPEGTCFIAVPKNMISKDKIREIVIPTPDNPIPLEIQQSEFYTKILKVLEEK